VVEWLGEEAMASLSEEIPPEEARRLRVFLPALYARAERAIAGGQRFVHYTGAAAAMGMIRNREIWLRNTQCMNDFSEVRHGLDLVREAYRGPAGARLLDFLDGIHPGLRARAAERFEAVAATIRGGTYITCLSEHDRAEDHLGRLSMRRAYSQACGVALVLNSRPLLGRGSSAVGVNAGPVEYADRRTFLKGFEAFAEAMRGEEAYLAGLGLERACENLAGGYYQAALSTKHPGFAEEREWRVVFNPTLDAGHLVRSVEVCRGEPQVIYRLPLVNRPEAGIEGMALADILEALIIGPSDNPRAVRDAFVELLADAGVGDPEARVRISDIPVR
jgi:hypothetical protein